MPNQRRRAKKARKKAATNGQLIPGVPAFHQGTAPEPGQEQRLHDSFFGAHEHGAAELTFPGFGAPIEAIVTYISSRDAEGQAPIDAVTALFEFLNPTGTGGGGVGARGPSA